MRPNAIASVVPLRRIGQHAGELFAKRVLDVRRGRAQRSSSSVSELRTLAAIWGSARASCQVEQLPAP